MGIRFALCLLVVCCLAITASAAGSNSLKPEGYVKEWTILGPFENPERPTDAKDRGAFDVDYLRSLGGEAKARIKPDTVVLTSSEAARTIRIEGKSVKLDGDVLDFTAHYTDTEHELAYAYTEIESPKDQEALFFLGSDDGVKVWVNGKLVHDNLVARAAVAREDRIKVKLHKGTNTILCKVENGAGDWALVMEAYAGEKADRVTAEVQAAENAKSFQSQELGLATGWPGYAFWPAWGGIPTIIWRDVDTVRKLVGDVPITVRWFDAGLNEVKSPDKPGRYSAYIEGKLKDGTPVRRAMTFFCDEEGGSLWDDWVNPEKQIEVAYPAKPVDPQVWEEQKEVMTRDIRSMRDTAMWSTQDGAIILAALLEAKPMGRKATSTESPQVINDEFQLALKLKLLGLTDKTKPLTPPKHLDKPVPVIREGTLAQAGMKPDAKEKIDAVCRKWAEDSGEPFTILVARNGVIITHEAFGPVGLDYRTDVASITKTVSGMLFSQFLDQGYCRPDDPIGKVVPGFPTKGEHMLTYRHLFTHTNGLEGHGEWGGIHNPWLDNVVLNGLEALHPGRVLVYNGMGYNLAGKAMEYMSGKSIVRLFHDHLFRPLGINDVPLNDLGYGANLTAHEMSVLGQWLANHGSYGDKQFITDETFDMLLPEPLSKYYPSVNEDWGIGLTWMPEQKPGAPAASMDPKDLIFGPRTIGHASGSGCILRVDLDRDLVIAQIRKTPGPKYSEYGMEFYQTIADEMVNSEQ